MVLVLVVVTAALGGSVAVLSGAAAPVPTGTPGEVDGNPSGEPSSGVAVPSDWEGLEQRAAATCPGLPWSILAAIGRIESDSGRSGAPGVAAGANPAGAEGPMQFEPATFVSYATVGPGGMDPASPYDPTDAVYTAAALLCADGGGTASRLAAAVLAYNHSDAYVNSVLVLASGIQDDPQLDSVVASALQFAGGQIGTPYRWGGTGDGGFDCSGLVQVAYRSAGISLPRVAQDQFDAGPLLPQAQDLMPGDLVFFGGSKSDVTHVGIYVSAGEMIDAPHAGADVRVERADWPDFVGATRPG